LNSRDEEDEEMTGLRIVVQNFESAPPRARALYHAIHSSGFEVDSIANQQLEDDAVRLVVLTIPADGGWVLSFPKP
jgi:hypothetical protein